jgi:hypothetical protein
MTFEITTHSHLTKRGDCILAVKANRSLRDLSPNFKQLCKNAGTLIVLEIEAGGISESIIGRGSPVLRLDHPSEIVGRKSTYISDRTLMIQADKSACDLSRELVRELKSPTALVQIRLIAEL